MTTASEPRKPTLAFIYFTVILDVLALGIIIPVLLKIVEEFRGGTAAEATTHLGIFDTLWALRFIKMTASIPVMTHPITS